MSVKWKDLPKEVLDRVCTDQCYTKPQMGGWTLDPETKHWVRPVCRKPTLQAVLLQCDLCDKYFVPKFHEKVKYRALGAMCDECDPPG